MLNEREKLHAPGNRRTVLVADDEAVNRELLGLILETDYQVLFAADGKEALEKIGLYQETLSLVILDLMMPGMDGLTLLQHLHNDPELSRVPVIVMTSESAAEVESLRLGAIDFIPKPYPQPEVILARVLRTIELCEDRQIIQDTERDALTGLYNMEFFFRYAEQYDQYNRDAVMDAIVLDINHFHVVNERYGKACGDRLLVRVAQRLLEYVRPLGGLVCRRDSDMFLVYCPHQEEHDALAEAASVTLEEQGEGARVRLRMGVYAACDKTIDIERRFDRAKLAADTVRNNYARQIAVYDDALHESELYAEQLADDFPRALKEKQFKVFFQPKYEIAGAAPVLSSAEALVRWQHPRLGLVAPGRFIPLFEDNGMIRALDHYVWRETLEQIRAWRDRFGRCVPVSVNVSRVDMFDEALVDTLQQMVAEYGLTPADLLLEITESAYTNDADLIISTVRALRDAGFRIEMDDFGTGYSSLGMLSHLPVDALKLDMMFVRNAFGEKKDVRMLELIIDISNYLDVPVIAEGVETKEQMEHLRRMGCEIVQGYYFSRPVPAEEFEAYLVAWLRQPEQADNVKKPDSWEQCAESQQCEKALEIIAQALSGDHEALWLVQPATGRYLAFEPDGNRESLKPADSGEDFFETCCREELARVEAADLAQAKRFWSRQHLLQSAKPAIYRASTEDGIRYKLARAIPVTEAGESCLVVAVSDCDEQVHREQQLLLDLHRAREAANRDPLTGVKSKRAFLEAEQAWDELGGSGEREPFAIVVCDVNGLKLTNDTRGHKAGDLLLQRASRLICITFKHSPVYRIGGDEFVALLRGQDYDARAQLLEELQMRNGPDAETGMPLIAYGMAACDLEKDATMEAVFDRADAAMYICKNAQKA